MWKNDHKGCTTPFLSGNVSKYSWVGGYVVGSGSPFERVTGTVRAGLAGIGFDFGVYLGNGDIEVGVGVGLAGEIVVDDEEGPEGFMVCGETEPRDWAPPSPGFGTRRPPVCMSRLATCARDIEERDIVMDVEL